MPGLFKGARSLLTYPAKRRTHTKTGVLFIKMKEYKKAIFAEGIYKKERRRKLKIRLKKILYVPMRIISILFDNTSNMRFAK